MQKRINIPIKHEEFDGWRKIQSIPVHCKKTIKIPDVDIVIVNVHIHIPNKTHRMI